MLLVITRVDVVLLHGVPFHARLRPLIRPSIPKLPNRLPRDTPILPTPPKDPNSLSLVQLI